MVNKSLRKFHDADDGARPFVTSAIVERTLDALAKAPAAIAALPVVDTLKRAGDDERIVTDTVARDGLWRAQTPQAFRFDASPDCQVRQRLQTQRLDRSWPDGPVERTRRCRTGSW